MTFVLKSQQSTGLDQTKRFPWAAFSTVVVKAAGKSVTLQ